MDPNLYFVIRSRFLPKDVAIKIGRDELPRFRHFLNLHPTNISSYSSISREDFIGYTGAMYQDIGELDSALTIAAATKPKIKQPILLLASCLADGTDYYDYEIVGDRSQNEVAHKMLLDAENEGRKENNRHYPDDLMTLLTAENSPLNVSPSVYSLAGEGDDDGEGYRVFVVPPPEQS